MIKYTFTLLCLAFTWAASGQDKGITFQVEALKRPDGLIAELPGKEITARIAPEALASSIGRDNQVYLGAHPFFNGMYKAYAEHRPFELSPDMIWLLICQGFAQHVNNNAEALRSYFVNFEGRKSLTVGLQRMASPGKLSTWENLLPKLLEQAGANSDPELFATLAPTFSTTGAAERMAMQITALESTKAYFEYIVLYVACGIPEITLKGTPEDWKQVAAKAALLRKYNLDWWIDELAPLLEQFVQASEGKTDRPFWRNMFKYHTRKVYGAPKVIDGWIVKFFPYNHKRQRNDLKSISNADDLPDERVKVDFSLVKVLPDGRTETRPMQFIAGFTSLKQDHKTMRLTPQIGWLVSPPQQNPHLARLKKESRSGSEPIRIRVSEVPEAILALKTIEAIEIEFLDSIRIPEQMATLKIEWMMLSGKITNEEKTRIAMLFPDTYIKINDEAQKNRQYEVIKKREAQEMAELLQEIREEQAGAANQTGK